MQHDIKTNTHTTLSLLCANVPKIVVSALFTAVVLAASLWPVTNHITLATWLTLFVLSLIIRIYIYHQYKKREPVKNPFLWEKYMMLSSLPSFLCWGAAGIFLFSAQEPAYQTVLIIILTIVATNGAQVLYVVHHYLASFLFIVLSPVTISLLLQGNTPSQITATIITLLALYLFSVSKKNHASYQEKLQLLINEKQHEAITQEEKAKTFAISARLKEAENIAHMGCWEWDVSSQKIHCSQEVFRILDIPKPPAESTPESLLSHINSNHKKKIELFFAKLMLHQQPLERRFKINTQDNTVRTVRFMGKPTSNDLGDIVSITGVVQDISEQVLLEEQLLHAQKMESIGILAGGIAHDFNNMLASILGHTYMAKTEAKNNTKLITRIERVENISNRAASMVEQLLTFSRKDQPQHQTINLTDFIHDSSTLNEIAVPESITVQTKITTKNLQIHADTTQLQQVMLNLINNAVHALKKQKNPKIAIHLENFEPTPQFQEQHALHHNHLAHLSICDNGCGIKEDAIKRIFEPFYTSKGVGEGTGLGLAMVYGVIQNHQGLIIVNSTIDQGTTFHIYLPIIHEDEMTLNQSKPLQQMPAHTPGHETILLIDDEEDLRLSLAEALESLGYKVFSAEDGQQAVDIFQQHQKNIAIILSDIVMPHMGGHEAAHHIRKTSPNIPFIFMSGYDPSQLSSKNSLEYSILIQKPMHIDKLHHHIRQFLDTPANNT